MNNRFIIGIGSQRAGTTLLHRLIGESSSIFMHPVKELHYFDTLNGIRPQAALADFSLRQLSREIDTIISADNHEFINTRYKCMLRTNKILAFQRVTDISYSDLFRPMLIRRELLGETTPEYMLLSPDQINNMANVIGRDAAIILLCRDPVKRLLSSAKLFNIYNNLQMDSASLSEWLLQMVESSSQWILAQDKYNDYETAVKNFSAVFPRFIALSYEQMIRHPADTAKQLENALGTSIDSDLFVKGSCKVANQLSDNNLDDSRLNHVLAERYRESREFLQHYFGSTYA